MDEQRECPFNKVFTPDEIVDLFIRLGLAEITEDDEGSPAPQ